MPRRRHDAEWMDRDGNSAADVEAALRDLSLVNRFLGGSASVLAAADRFLLEIPEGGTLDVLDVGSGGGDVSSALVRRGQERGRSVRVVAVDRDGAAASYARRALGAGGAFRVLRADAFALPFRERSFDLVVASLFLHHFRHGEAVELLRRFLALARRAVVVSDLRRHVLPWAFIAVAARVTRRHPIFVHDAPLSVLRGFTGDELRRAALDAGCPRPRVDRCWPYRLVLVAPAEAPAP